MIPEAAVDHYRKMQRLQAVAVLAARRAWRGVDAGDLSSSWEEMVPEVAAAVTLTQVKAASEGALYGAKTIAQQGFYEPPQHFVDPEAFGGYASDGRPLEGLLYAAVPHAKNLIAGGMGVKEAVQRGGSFLEMLTKTQVADAGRAAAGIDTAVRAGVGYVRMLNPPSCSRCSILAGRFYRWNAGFQRHPGCDCIHVPAKNADAASSEGLIHDPYEYFQSLSAAEQDRFYTKAGAQAIRDGSDIFQVVNSRRGMKPGGLMTTEGTTRRGNFGRNGALQTRGRRLTPEAIYELNGNNKEAVMADLRKYGYVLPGGQNPLGSIVGQRQGHGQLGHGGSYSAARKRIEDAIANGRDPNVRATMTAAERRLYDAKARWELVQQGVNPYTAPSMTPRAKPMERPLTPEIAAQVEQDYRRWITTRGEIFGGTTPR